MDSTYSELSGYFSHMIDFENKAGNILHNKTFDEFLAWFEELRREDKRALYLYLCEHADELTDKEREYAQEQLKRPVSKKFAIKERNKETD